MVWWIIGTAEWRWQTQEILQIEWKLTHKWNMNWKTNTFSDIFGFQTEFCSVKLYFVRYECLKHNYNIRKDRYCLESEVHWVSFQLKINANWVDQVIMLSDSKRSFPKCILNTSFTLRKNTNLTDLIFVQNVCLSLFCSEFVYSVWMSMMWRDE